MCRCTFLQSLYLFFDLPPLPTEREVSDGVETVVYNGHRRRELLVKMFSQVCDLLCDYYESFECNAFDFYLNYSRAPGKAALTVALTT